MLSVTRSTPVEMYMPLVSVRTGDLEYMSFPHILRMLATPAMVIPIGFVEQSKPELYNTWPNHSFRV